MPRSHHRRPEPPDDASFDRLLAGWRRTEMRRGREWSVQPVSGAKSVKSYVCPGCGGQIERGTAHVVAWREDGALGAEADLASRRHWHGHCWRMS